jgi:signal transduction histidine kinase
MHFAKEYISKYNLAKENIKDRITHIELELDTLLLVKKIDKIDDIKKYYDLEFSKRFNYIEINIKFIIDSLEELQTFCHEDVRKIIPLIKSLNEYEEDEAFQKAKDIDWLIDIIDKEVEISAIDKKNLLDISEFNKKVRYFIHSTIAFVQNPLPVVAQSKLERMQNKNEMTYSSNELYEDICYCLSECYRIRRAIEQFHILSNVDYGHWESYKTTLEELKKYFEVYKYRFEGFFYNNELHKIYLEINNKVELNTELELPIIKVKEVIDILLHNAAEELLEKELESKVNYEKKIVCTIEKEQEELIISIKDNGRGIEKGEIERAFVSTKSNIKNYGIGLDVANKNARILEGKITNFNNEIGATFLFKFPIRKVQII